jgi:tRNA(fMet)-specific endonuclease VapC
MISYAEVIRGIPSPDEVKRRATAKLFGLVPPLAFDRAAADIYAGLPFKRASYDRLIAAHALALGLTLVTANVKDFADIRGLKIENWTLPE